MNKSSVALAVALAAAAFAIVEEAWAQQDNQLEQITAIAMAQAAPYLAQSFAFASMLMWVIMAGVSVVIGALILTYATRWVSSSGLNQTRLVEGIKTFGRRNKDDDAPERAPAQSKDS